MDRSLDRLEGTDPDTATDGAETNGDTRSSRSAEWCDMSVRTDAPVEHAGSTRQSVPQRAAAGEQAADRQHITDRIQSRSGESLTVETPLLTATLVGVPQVQLAEFVYTHQRESLQAVEATRACALFDIENTSSRRLRWTSRRTAFIGSDKYTYRQAHVSLDPSKLGPGCYPRQVTIEPGCRARVITPVEQLPPAVDVAKVVQTVSAPGRRGSQQLTFSVK